MAKYRDPKVRVANAYQGQKRVTRSPSFPFVLNTRPYQIQPFMAAPVLPGETMSNLVLMSRAVSKPLASPLIGWWCEYYFFYVRLRDIEFHLKETKGLWLDTMVTQPQSFDPAPLRVAGDLDRFGHKGGGIPWLYYATQTCVEYFFRDQGENWDVATLDGLPLAQISGRSWLDSLTLDADARNRDVNLDLDADGVVQASEVEDGMEHWRALRDAGLETMDYEDWIRTFGVQVPEVEQSFNKYRPELIRYHREWQYPTNTIDPGSGTPSSAVSFVNAFRADKDRMFREPGFVIGLNVIKPKAYVADYKHQLSGFMDTLENWLPALSHKDYEKGFKHFSAGAGPLGGTYGDTGYWVDLRDLLVYGEQFTNAGFDVSANALSVLTAGGSNRYPKVDDIDKLFKTPALNFIQQDGIVSMNIKGRQMDHTPGRRTI